MRFPYVLRTTQTLKALFTAIIYPLCSPEIERGHLAFAPSFERILLDRAFIPADSRGGITLLQPWVVAESWGRIEPKERLYRPATPNFNNHARELDRSI